MKQCFAHKLQELRKKNGLSQEALAEILEVSRQSVSKWESGQVYPEIDKIIFLSKYFHVSIDELLKEDSVSQRKVINLSKPYSEKPFKNITKTPVLNVHSNEQDIMPQGYTNNISPVQPLYTTNNINIINNKKSSKKTKRKLGIPAILGLTALGGITISLIITAIMENYYNSENYTVYETTNYIEEEIVPENVIMVNDNGELIYEYDYYGILNKVYYYYDKSKEEYIEVLLPIEPFLEYSSGNSYGLEFANVYMENGLCIDVVMIDSEEDVQYMKYYSEQFGKYMPVLVPPTYDDFEFDYYGYKVVEVYIDGQMQKTIVKL